jgi:hypothetical protein
MQKGFGVYSITRGWETILLLFGQIILFNWDQATFPTEIKVFQTFTSLQNYLLIFATRKIAMLQ